VPVVLVIALHAQMEKHVLYVIQIISSIISLIINAIYNVHLSIIIIPHLKTVKPVHQTAKHVQVVLFAQYAIAIIFYILIKSVIHLVQMDFLEIVMEFARAVLLTVKHV
jgi:hypothetical protein